MKKSNRIFLKDAGNCKKKEKVDIDLVDSRY